jgi:hypothetical protein
MELVLGGITLNLPSLSPALDAQIIRFHEAFLAGGTLEVGQFHAAATEWLRAQSDDSRDDEYFKAFTIVWRNYLAQGHLSRAEHVWLLAIDPALSVEQSNPPGRHIHKGTVFYFWGMTALLAGNLDKGYALMHQAVEEDVLRSGGSWPSSPSTALATLDSFEENQAFREWVVAQAALLESFLEEYRQKRSGALTLQDMRNRLLTKPDVRDATFSLSYVLARLLKLREIPPYARDSAFVSQLELNLLFDLALVIDCILKPMSGSQGASFYHQAVYLANRASLGISGNQLGEANQAANRDFTATITTLISESGSVLNDRTTVLYGIEKDLAISYIIRNLGGHSMPSLPVLRQRKDQIEQAVFNTLFFAVETCY